MAIETNELIDVQTLPPFKKFIMSIGAIPTSYLDSMSYAELLAWFCNYLQNTVIPTINNNGEAVEELQDLFVELKNYVDNYFENLDVQDEINNKLDDLAENGTLEQLLAQYVNPILQNQNNQIADINNKVNSVASGSPLVASSTAGMTDTTRTYVNTTDGKWYYYDGDSWEIGGTYQATQFIEDEIKPFQEEAIIKNSVIPYNNWVVNKTVEGTSGNIINFTGGSYCKTHIPFTAGDKYSFIIKDLNNASLTNKALRVAFYEADDTWISSSAITFSMGQTTSFTVPDDTSYGLIYSYNLAIDSIYPSNYPSLVKKDEIVTIPDFTKSLYLNTNYQLVNNDNVYCQDKIMFTNFKDENTNIAWGFNEFINKYTLHFSRTYTAGDFPFFPIYIKNPTAGDKIRLKFLKFDSHIETIGLYAWTGTSNYINFTYNNETNEYEATLTDTIIENWFYDTNNIRICFRIKGITESTVVDFTVQINANNLCNNFTDIVNKLNEVKSVTTYKGLFLGDSITALTGDRSWITYFSNIIPLSSYNNVAVAGAHLTDYSDTIYDGNPVYNGADNNHNNVLGNQVQKIINNNYDDPDFIFIAIGTNDGINTTVDDAYSQYYNTDGTIKNLSSVNRQTSAGAFRYCNEKLHELYPNAIIVWCTPIQAVNTIRNIKNVIKWGDNLKLLCGFGSNICIDTEKCGINGINEINGSNGEDLIDGLHPNSHGAKKMGTFNACEFKKFLDKINLN